MNMHALPQTNFVAPVVAKPLPKTEAPIPPTPPCGRRALPFDAVAAVDSGLQQVPSGPRGRWDSARAVARNLFTGLIPTHPVAPPNLIQLELHFA